MQWRRRRSDHDFEAEIQAHLELEADELIREGMPHRDADAASRRAFGNVTAAREQFHESRGVVWLERLEQDVRYALRRLRRAPGFTSAALLTLALGISLTTTVFSIASAMLLRPVPYPDPNGLVVIFRTEKGRSDREWVPASDLTAYRSQSHSFSELAAYYQGPFTLEGPDGAQLFDGAIVTTNSFRVLREQPLLGRDFLPEEDIPGHDRVVILGWNLWKERFGGSPGVIGQVVTLNGKQRTIVGVMKPGFQFPEMESLWVPAVLEPTSTRSDQLFVVAFARLAAGTSLTRANAEIASIARRLNADTPGLYDHWGARVDGFRERLVGSYFIRTPFLLLLAAVMLVLLLACANIAHLQLARGLARRRELALRAALGAGRSRLARQLITESLILSLAGGVFGVFVSVVLVRLIRGLVPIALPDWLSFELDSRVLIFALIASLGSGVIFGVVPAIDGARLAPGAALKEGGSTSHGGRSHPRLRGALIVLELSLSLVLLVTAMLTLQSFLKLAESSLGFDPHGVVTAEIALAGPPYDSAGNRTALFSRVLNVMSARPGIEVGAISYLPTNGGSAGPFETEDHPVSLADAPIAVSNVVAGDFFSTLRIPILGGRGFTEREWEDTSSNVVIINQTMARQAWPHQAALGRRVRMDGAPKGPWLTVIGVVGDIAQNGLGVPKQPQLFRVGAPGYSMSLVVRGKGGAGAIMTAIRKSVATIDPRVPVYDFATLDEVIARSTSVWLPRLYGILFGVFASSALLLAIIGVYGVVAFDAGLRTKEIGLRVALGASPVEIIRMMLARIAVLTIAGVAIGLGASLAAGHVLRVLLYGISESDPSTLIAVPLALIAVVLIASFVPARRAAVVDPSLALRDD